MAKIIWVDEDIHVIEPVIFPLKKAGHKFIYYNSIAEATIEIDQLRTADLILLDLLVPPGPIDRKYGRYPGKDFFKELIKDHKIDTPVIVFSVVLNEDVHKELNRLGVFDVVTKPVRPSILADRVNQALKSKK